MRGFFALVVLLTLAACASLPPPGAGGEVFALQGRVFVQYGEETLSGLLSWQAQAAGDEILLSSPLGQGLAEIRRDAGGVWLNRPGQPELHADSAEALTETALGFRLPLDGLRHWIRGEPRPGADSETASGEDGRCARIVQDGWTINYLQYQDARPRKIEVLREDLKIRLVIDEWRQ